MSERKFGQIGRLKPEKIEEYKRLHRETVHTSEWKGVLEMIHDCNIRNYSIFIEGDVVFGYFEYVGADYAQDMRKMAADKTTQDWWKLTKPCFTKYADGSTVEFYTDMEQIFDFTG